MVRLSNNWIINWEILSIGQINYKIITFTNHKCNKCGQVTRIYLKANYINYPQFIKPKTETIAVTEKNSPN